MKNQSSTLADNVENILLKYIGEHKLQPGDALPKETELVETLQISRHIIREALNRLKAMGLVEARKHRGTVFCTPEPFIGFQKLAEAGMFSKEDRKHFMELRVAMELGMCSFIFARRSPEKIAILRSKAGAEGETVHSLQDELDFHTTLMAFAENPAADGFRRVLTMAFGDRASKKECKDMTPSHQQICDQLERGDEISFQQIMRKHLHPYL